LRDRAWNYVSVHNIAIGGPIGMVVGMTVGVRLGVPRFLVHGGGSDRLGCLQGRRVL
jgi:hypothetical protein